MSSREPQISMDLVEPVDKILVMLWAGAPGDHIVGKEGNFEPLFRGGFDHGGS